MDTSPATLRTELRRELLDGQVRFHSTLEAVAAEIWDAPSTNPGWNVRQVVGHMADQPAAAAKLVGLARSGRGLLNHAPIRLVDAMNRWQVRLRTRGLSPEAARTRFDTGFLLLAALVDEIGDDEFDHETTAFREQHSVADAFRELGRQLDDHVPQVIGVIGDPELMATLSPAHRSRAEGRGDLRHHT